MMEIKTGTGRSALVFALALASVAFAQRSPSSQPALSLTVAPEFSLPIGADASYFGPGAGGGISGTLRFPSLPVYAGGGLSYTFLPTLAQGTSISVLDLGARATQVEIEASGVNAFSGVTAAANYKSTLPIPQIGPSLGCTAFDGRLVAKGMFHLLSYKGSSYTHTGADLRVFPISWLGVRAYFDHEHTRVPKGSIKDDLDITEDRNGTGLGIVARF